jgi:hypothetical protein
MTSTHLLESATAVVVPTATGTGFRLARDTEQLGRIVALLTTNSDVSLEEVADAILLRFGNPLHGGLLVADHVNASDVEAFLDLASMLASRLSRRTASALEVHAIALVRSALPLLRVDPSRRRAQLVICLQAALSGDRATTTAALLAYAASLAADLAASATS